MLRQLILRKVAAFERDYGYDAGYLKDLLDTDLRAFLRFTKMEGISRYRQDLPVAASYAAKIVGTLVEDCGPCTQLVVTMAEREGVPAQALRAVLSGDDDALDADVRLAVRFSRAVLARDVAADALREQVLARWGRRGLVSLGFGLVAARLYPTLKYALGHGKACSRVTVAGAAVQAARQVQAPPAWAGEVRA